MSKLMSDAPVVPVLIDGQIVPMLDVGGAWHGKTITTRDPDYPVNEEEE